MISAVIPAHNEGVVLGALLQRLDAAVDAGELEVVVVANGCSDDTASVARAHSCRLIELPEGSKIGALRAGDAAATAFPRFYVDADIGIGSDDLREMARSLERDVAAVAPTLVLDQTNAGWMVRSYHRIWAALPSVSCSLAGRGCFGLSEAGRGRWGDWPDVVADDQFVNQQFSPAEKHIVAGVSSTVRIPSSLGSLIRRKRRSHRGNVDLQSAMAGSVTSSTAWLGVVRARPRLVKDVPVYLVATIAIRILAALDRKRGRSEWTTDQSSRTKSDG